MSALIMASGAAAATVGVLVYLIIVIIVIAGWWMIFVKAGRPGWGAIIPFYNIYLMCKVARRPGWWLILFLIPLVNIVISLIVAIDVAKQFSKGAGFGV